MSELILLLTGAFLGNPTEARPWCPAEAIAAFSTRAECGQWRLAPGHLRPEPGPARPGNAGKPFGNSTSQREERPPQERRERQG